MKRVLITEDDALMAEIYRDSFEREGFSAEIAADGAIAMQRLNGNPPDIVLLDLMMPKFNGLEVLKYIRSSENTRALPVIVMSNALASALGQQAAAAGATRMLAKNACGPRRLVKEVREVLGGGAPEAGEAAPTNGEATMPLAASRKDTTDDMRQRIGEIRDLLQMLGKGETMAVQARLLELHRAVHQLAGTVSFAGFARMAQLACALEVLVKELHGIPERVNPSSLHTAVQAMNVLASLVCRSGQPENGGVSSPLILVVDDEAISRETICTALERAHLRAMRVEDPLLALKLAEENRFDLVFMDVQMPGMDGFAVCKRILATSLNSKTPIVFVTSLTDPQSRARFGTSGGIDFIGKPIWPIEVAVKALTYLIRD